MINYVFSDTIKVVHDLAESALGVEDELNVSLEYMIFIITYLFNNNNNNKVIYICDV